MNLNQANLTQARQLYAQGNLAGMYNYLALNCGDRYAELAKGVVTGDTISGAAAIDFMKNTAEQQGKTLSESDLNKIHTDMADAYLKTLGKIADAPDNNGVVTRDITAKEAQSFHDKVNQENGLSIDAWTLNTPFNIIGESNAQNWWGKILDSAGDPVKETAQALTLHEWMGLMSSFLPRCAGQPDARLAGSPPFAGNPCRYYGGWCGAGWADMGSVR